MSSEAGPSRERLKDKSHIVPLNDDQNAFRYPWKAYYHSIKKLKFYFNKETKESVWAEHLSNAPAPTSKCDSNRKRRSATQESTQIERTTEEELNSDEDLMDFEEMPSTPPSFPKPQVDDEPAIKKTRNPDITEETEVISCPTILPDVPWRDLVQSRNVIPYRACAILDTNVLISKPDIAKTTIEKQILTVIPYSVVQELDGLKKNRDCTINANKACRIMQELKAEKHYYIELESSVEQSIELDVFKREGNVKDDFILKCAIRVKIELLSVANILKFDSNMIVFVSNDLNLKLKAQAHGITVLSSPQFLSTITSEQPTQLVSEKRMAACSHERVMEKIKGKNREEEARRKSVMNEKVAMKRLKAGWHANVDDTGIWPTPSVWMLPPVEGVPWAGYKWQEHAAPLLEKLDPIAELRGPAHPNSSSPSISAEPVMYKPKSNQKSPSKMKKLLNVKEEPIDDDIQIIGVVQKKSSRSTSSQKLAVPSPPKSRSSRRQAKKSSIVENSNSKSSSKTKISTITLDEDEAQPSGNQNSTNKDQGKLSGSTKWPKLPLPHPSEEDPNWQATKRKTNRPANQVPYKQMPSHRRTPIIQSHTSSSSVDSTQCVRIESYNGRRLPLPHPSEEDPNWKAKKNVSVGGNVRGPIVEKKWESPVSASVLFGGGRIPKKKSKKKKTGPVMDQQLEVSNQKGEVEEYDEVESMDCS